ncbi:MAG: di-trans,poly-cis-decaprenylcistransferase [bacterium]|nr:di-trans,poly-cis-decaprenylcistransferase [bacterium]
MTREATSLENPAVLPAHGVSGVRIVSELWRAAKDLVKQPFYTLYLRRLRAKSHTWRHPAHLGVIMDGNRRFARQAGYLSALAGHRLGAEKLQDVLQWCHDAEVPVVTVWCFSLENFQRSAEEVEDLLGLFEDKTREMADSGHVHEHRIRVRFIGRLELLPESLRHEIRRVEEATRDYEQLQLNIAMAYGGREEIADAFRRHIADRIADGEGIHEVLQDLDAGSIAPYLYTSGQPEPDLILRTSGEVRLSGFLLWQSAYSEFYFCDTNWPAFREIDFLRALRAYDERQRRYGR